MKNFLLLTLLSTWLLASAQRGGAAADAETASQPTELQQLAMQLDAANKYFSNQKYDAAAENLKQAAALAHRLNDAREGNILAGLGNAYEYLGKFKASRDAHWQAIAWKTAHVAEPRSLARSYSDYGHIVGARLDSFQRGSEYLLKAADIFAKYPDTLAVYFQAYCYSEAGIICTAGQEMEKGIGLCLKALQLQRSIADYAGMAMTYRHLTVTYIERKEYAKAHAYLDKAMVLANDVNDNMVRSGILLNKGVAFEAEKKYPEAIEAYEQAFALMENSPLKNLAAEAAHSLSVLHKRQHNREKAKLYAARYEALKKEIQ